jgi:hypothetical protein
LERPRAQILIDGRPNELERGAQRQASFGIEENIRHGHDVSFTKEPRNDTWPRCRVGNQPSGRRVGNRVRDLVENILVVHEQDDTRLLRRPKVFPPAQGRVLCARKEPVELLEELRKTSKGIGDDPVPMVGHEANGMKKDARSLSC